MPRNRRASERGRTMVEAPATNLETMEENPVSDTTFDEGTALVDQDVDLPAADETDEVPANENSGAEPKAKAEKARARGDLPAHEDPEDKWVTPVQFAKELTAHLAAKGESNKKGLINTETNQIPPQQIYSYERNAPKDNPMPTTTVTDSIGVERKVLSLKTGLEWWDNKSVRKQERAEAKAAKEAEKAQKKATAATAAPVAEAEATDEAPVTEAE
jgi:hypothetical protein